MFRSYYFGQVIYFTQKSQLDAVASLTLLVAIGGLSALLIPRYGVEGAAIAMATGQALACLVFIVGSRERFRMPVPLRDLATMARAGFAFDLAKKVIDAASPDALDEV